MDDTLTQNLKKQFDALPSNVQKAISAVDLSTKLQQIVKNNKLMIDQAGKLETETVLVLFGLEPLENYVNNLVKKIGLSGIQASIIAHDVNELIFKDIRETLKIINDGLLKEEGGTAETTKNGVPSRGEAMKSEVPSHSEIPTKEDVLAGIEHPENIKDSEQSISISSLKSNGLPAQAGAKPEVHEMIDEGIEIRPDILPRKMDYHLVAQPEIAPKATKNGLPSRGEAILPAISTKNGVPSRGEATENDESSRGEATENDESSRGEATENDESSRGEATENEELSRGVTSLISKPTESYHQNISPVLNIVKSKLEETVVVPKKTIIVEEKTKLPEKPRLSTDPYRETII